MTRKERRQVAVVAMYCSSSESNNSSSSTSLRRSENGKGRWNSSVSACTNNMVVVTIPAIMAARCLCFRKKTRVVAAGRGKGRARGGERQHRRQRK